MTVPWVATLLIARLMPRNPAVRQDTSAPLALPVGDTNTRLGQAFAVPAPASPPIALPTMMTPRNAPVIRRMTYPPSFSCDRSPTSGGARVNSESAAIIHGISPGQAAKTAIPEKGPGSQLRSADPYPRITREYA